MKEKGKGGLVIEELNQQVSVTEKSGCELRVLIPVIT